MPRQLRPNGATLWTMTEPPNIDASTPLDFFEACLRQSTVGLGRVTVAILGRTGAGKSTLINAVFGQDVAATGAGAPVTPSLVEHRPTDGPLVLLDSRGLELGGDAGEEAADLVASEIERRASLAVSEALHVVWFCVDAGTGRFEPSEKELVRRCAERVPTIVVLTKAPDPHDADVTELHRYIEELRLPHAGVVSVLAADRRLGGRSFEAHGVDALIGMTIDVLPEAARRAFIVTQRHAVEQQVVEARAVVSRAALTAAALGERGGVDPTRLARHQLRMLAEVSAIFSVSIPESTQRAMVAAVTRGADGMAQIAQTLLRLLDENGVPGMRIVEGFVAAGAATGATRAVGEAYVRLCREIAVRTLDGRPLPDQELLDAFRSLLQ